MRYLLTGASGFIGRRLAKHLTDRGQKVTALVRKTSVRGDLEAMGVGFAVGDLNSGEGLEAAVEVAAQTFAPEPEADMLVSGQTNLMGDDASQMDRLRELFEAFQRKRDLLALLESCARAPGVRLFIGGEAGFAPLEGFSLISAPYHAGDRVLGALGVIGPTRMAYDRVIPVVQATARMLSDALNPGT